MGYLKNTSYLTEYECLFTWQIIVIWIIIITCGDR